MEPKTKTTPINPVLFAVSISILGATCFTAIEGILPFGTDWAKAITVMAFIGAAVSYLKVWEKSNVQ